MAWGVFKKIKDGLYKAGKKVWDTTKKVAAKTWDVGKKVINKVGGLVPLASTALNSVAPGLGTAVQTGYTTANNFVNSSTGNAIGKWLDNS
jgi:hypothetical protein